ncbi:MAG: hypothetical protein Q9212_002203 [Teloschistes hypoglaucus]
MVDIDRFVNNFGAEAGDVNLVIILPPRLYPGLTVLGRASDGILSQISVHNSSPPRINVQPSSATNNQVIHGDNADNDEAPSSASATTSLITDSNTSTHRPLSHSNSRRRSNPVADTPPMANGDLPSTETENPIRREERLFQLGESLRNYLRYNYGLGDVRIVHLIHEIEFCSRPGILAEDLDEQRLRRTRLAGDLRDFFRYDAASSVALRYLEVLNDTPRIDDNNLPSTEAESPMRREERLFQLGESLRYYLRYDYWLRGAHIMHLIHDIELCSLPEILTEDLNEQRLRRTRLAGDLRDFFRYDAASSMVFRYLEVLDEHIRSVAHNYISHPPAFLDGDRIIESRVENSEFAASDSTPPNHSPPHVPVQVDDPITITVPNEVLFDAETGFATSHNPSPLQVHFDDPITIEVPNEVRSDAGTNIGTSHRPTDDEPYINDIGSTSPRYSSSSYTATNPTTATNTGGTTHTSSPLPALMSGALPDEPAPPPVLVPFHDPPASSITNNTSGTGVTFVWPMGPLSNFENTNTEQESGVVEVDWNDREHYDRGNWHSRGDEEATAAESARNSTEREVSHDGVGEGGSGGVLARQEARRRLMSATRHRRLEGYRTSVEAMVEAASDEW